MVYMNIIVMSLMSLVLLLLLLLLLFVLLLLLLLLLLCSFKFINSIPSKWNLHPFNNFLVHSLPFSSKETEMDTFFDSNPGFKSRVPFTFRFEEISGSLIALRVVEFKVFSWRKLPKTAVRKETAAERQMDESGVSEKFVRWMVREDLWRFTKMWRLLICPVVFSI